MSASDTNSDTVGGASDADAGDSPVTLWLRKLEAGDRDSVGDLYQHFCPRLHRVIRGQLPSNVRAAYDDDDVAVSAFHSLFLGVRDRRYQFDNRADFWRLLMTIAERKIAKRI